MKLRLLYFIAAAILVLASCSKDDTGKISREHEQRVLNDFITTYYPNETPTESGLYFIPSVEGTGLTPSDLNEYVFINFNEYSAEYFSLYNTTNKELATEEGLTRTILAKNGPLKINLGDLKNLIPGMHEGLLKMKEGGKARLILPSSLANTNYIPVYIDVELLKVVSDPAAFEMQQLSQYLADNHQVTLNDSTTTDQTGLYIFDTLEGTGELPNADSTITCNYTLRLIPYNDGQYLNVPARVFEEDKTLGPFKLDDTNIIKGFIGAVKRIKTNGKATVIIPYHWAYGKFNFYNQNGQIDVPAYSTLIYDIEVTDN